MWPWGHAAVGFLAYVAIATITGDRRYGLPILAVLLGTQMPDLIDKPFAWTIPILPNGRSLAHSLVTAGPVLALGVWVGRARLARRVERVAVAGFALGYVTHVLGDGLYPFVDAEFGSLSFLAWPVLEPPVYETDPSFVAHFQQLELAGTVYFEIALVGLAIVVWAWLRATRHRDSLGRTTPQDAD